jgi:hypothetical protein
MEGCRGVGAAVGFHALSRIGVAPGCSGVCPAPCSEQRKRACALSFREQPVSEAHTFGCV